MGMRNQEWFVESVRNKYLMYHVYYVELMQASSEDSP